MKHLKKEDEKQLQDAENNADQLRTEGPVSEKDEVKQAEDATMQNEQQMTEEKEKLKDKKG